MTYATTRAGLAATTSGQYFRVPQGTSATSSFIYYLNNAGSALAVADAVDKAEVDAVAANISALSGTVSPLVSALASSTPLPSGTTAATVGTANPTSFNLTHIVSVIIDLFSPVVGAENVLIGDVIGVFSTAATTTDCLSLSRFRWLYD